MNELDILKLTGQELLLLFCIFLLCLIPYIYYLITLKKTVDLIKPENREFTSTQIWLLLIPIFNLVWRFVIVLKLAKSLNNEFSARNYETKDENFGKNIGIAFSVLLCCGIIPFFGIMASLAGLVCWVIYWVKIWQYKTILENLNSDKI